MKVCIVLGTRPELIKFTPVIEALQRKPSIELCVINTGQHTNLLDVIPDTKFKENLRWPPVSGAPLNWTLAHIIQQLALVLTKQSPALVLVQGDTTSALAGALAAANLQIPIGHVEAGLRTYDKASPFPEENNRRLISVIATYHFCISETSLNNLMSEHVGGTKILTGSTAIDMVKRIPIHEAGPKKYILLTLHRRENIETDRAAAYLKALCAFLNQHNDPEDRITCMWITHPNPKVQALVKNIDQPANMGISEAAEYTRFIQYAQHAWAICSDSGGIQEENTVLRCPLFILRDSTERPEVLTSKNVKLVQKSEMLETLLQELYDKPETYTVTGENKMFGSGDAGERIVNFIEGLGR